MAEEWRLGLDVSRLTFTPGKKERGDWRRGEEYGPLPRQLVWRPTSPRPLENEEIERVCLLMRVCFNALQGMFIFLCVCGFEL